MLAMGLKRFLRLTYLSLFKSEGTHGRLTEKRKQVLKKLYFFMYPIQLFQLLFLILDNLFFPRFRRVEIKAPLFILGNPRGGTTHLLRLLALDEKRFYCPRTWETFFVASILGRKLVSFFGKIDAKAGKMKQKIAEMEKDIARDLEKFHQFSFAAPDEDEGYFSPLFASIQLIFQIPFPEEFDLAFSFDTKVPEKQRRVFMKYYYRVIQRTLFMLDSARQYLSKAPSNSFRVDALRKYFPDAKFVYIARNPLQTIPSQMSFLTYQWHLWCEPLEEYPFRDFQDENTMQFYRYPLERLEQTCSEGSYAVVNYDDLIRDPVQTIKDVYDRLGLEVSSEYEQALEKAAQEASEYVSPHEYSLEAMGLSREKILADYQDFFDRFGFDKHAT